MDQEHRIFDRFQARFPVKFKDNSGDFGYDVLLRDASANGMNILTREKLFLNDHIALEVELPDGHDPLILSGRVMWSKPTGESSAWDTGLQFDKVDFMKMQRIFKYAELSSSNRF